jgi:hypothetical protein
MELIHCLHIIAVHVFGCDVSNVADILSLSSLAAQSTDIHIF